MAQTDPATAQNLLALLACLEEEYAALLAEDAGRLEDALVRKQRLLAELASQPGLALGPRQGRPAPAVAQALARARALNERNAIVLQPRTVANHARLRFLQSALGAVALYGADGQSTHERMAVAQGHRA
jgi:flagellar biosynthesis/type III secretory pathway chaperone